MNAGTARIPTIRARRDFLSATRGKRWVTPSFVLQALQRADDHPAEPAARVGYTVTKKMGNAATRNRIKRRLREAVKQVMPRHARPGHDYVLIARETAAACTFPELLKDMEFAFSRIHANKRLPD